MKKLFSFIGHTLIWFGDHFVGTCLTLMVIGSMSAYAATSYDVGNEVQMFLDQSMTATQTTAVLSAPQLNGTNFVFSTTTGGVIRIRSGFAREDVRYTAATVNQTTYKVTLTGLTRNLCPQVTRAYVSCGDGRRWGKGAIVELSQDARLFNLKANIDRPNVFSASGALAFTGSGSLEPPRFATTAERDRQLGAAPTTVKMACVTATNLCYLSTGGAWTAIGNLGNANGSEIAAGIFQAATIANLKTLTSTGSTGALNVVTVNNVIKNGTGAVSAGKVPSLGSDGVLSASFFPTSISNLGMFGDGSDGAVTWSTNTYLNPATQKRYTTVQLNTGATLGVSTANVPLVITTTGNVTIYGTINLNGSGAVGGAGGTARGIGVAANKGVAGSSGATIVSGWVIGSGGEGSGGTIGAFSAGAGGGGASFLFTGTGGTAGNNSYGGHAATLIDSRQMALLNSLYRNVGCGGGGGGGGGRGNVANTAANQGTQGGRGGGCSLWFIKGNLKLGSSSTITATGLAAAAAPGSYGGAGGGGGGNVLIIVNGTITNDGVTLSAQGGVGTLNVDSIRGGTGGRGVILIYSLTSGTLISY